MISLFEPHTFRDSVIFYEWFYGVYQIPFSLATLWLLWVLVRIDYKRKVFKESTVLFSKLWSDIYLVDADKKKFLNLLRYLRVVKPHMILASLKQFERLFRKCLLTIDHEKRLFALKSELLYVYGIVRDKMAGFMKKTTVENDRRRYIRYGSVEPIYYIDSPDNPPKDALLINVGGGGARFFTKKKVKKGQKVKLLFDKNALDVITAKILDVIQKTDFYVVRVKFPHIYSNA
jgi:hypothetical protein